MERFCSFLKSVRNFTYCTIMNSRYGNFSVVNFCVFSKSQFIPWRCPEIQGICLSRKLPNGLIFQPQIVDKMVQIIGHSHLVKRKGRK